MLTSQGLSAARNCLTSSLTFVIVSMSVKFVIMQQPSLKSASIMPSISDRSICWIVGAPTLPISCMNLSYGRPHLYGLECLEVMDAFVLDPVAVDSSGVTTS